MKKFLSAVLIVIGCFLLYAAVLNTVVRGAAGRAPEIGVVLVSVVLGGLALWGGIKLWNRWRMTAGIVSILLGISAIGNTLSSVMMAERAGGRTAELYDNLSTILPFLAGRQRSSAFG